MHNKIIIAVSDKKGLDNIICYFLDQCLDVKAVSSQEELCNELNKKEYQILMIFTINWELDFILELAKKAKEILQIPKF